MAVSGVASHRREASHCRCWLTDRREALDVGKFLCESELSLGEIAEVYDHQKVLHVVVQHVLEFFWVNTGNALNE